MNARWAAIACVVFLGLTAQTALAANRPLGVVRPPHQTALLPAASGPMTYQGGLVQLATRTYLIVWKPATLQSGKPARLATGDTTLVKRFLGDIGGSAWYNVASQYYQVVGKKTSFMTNTSGFGGMYTDTTSYPSSRCTNPSTGSNCIVNSDLQASVTRAITAKGWKATPKSQFIVLTANGEGSCFDATDSDCAYRDYCAYHTYFTLNGAKVVFTNMPYPFDGKSLLCAVSGQPSPNGNQPADYTINLLSHEFMESATDPGLNAWFAGDTSGEIGDLCAWNFGTAGLDGGMANQEMNGHFYYMQMEYSNANGGCVQTYP